MNEKYIFVSNPYKISCKNNSLIFTDKDGDEISIRTNDIAGVVIDNSSCTITANAICRLSEAGKLLFITDSKHQPICSLIPQSQHSRSSEKIKFQVKRYMNQDALWKKIIKMKMKNQVAVLNKLGYEQKAEKISKHLNDLKTIGQFDPIEAYASREFFSIYPQSYTRRGEHLVNTFQNYGYAIIRSTIIQYLNVYGLNSNLGIHHSSGENPNNLADDLIEPYRPYIDYVIFTELLEEQEFTREARKLLVGILDHDLMFGLHPTTVRHSIKLLVEQYNSYLINSNSINEISEISYLYE